MNLAKIKSLISDVKAVLKLWGPAILGSLMALLHAFYLPMFSGFDEPAHFSSILSFATDQGKPVHGQARFHKSVESAMGLVPAPISQLYHWKEKLNGIDYKTWRDLSLEEKRIKKIQLEDLKVSPWQDGEVYINWQAQHPPLYYAALGFVLKILRFENLEKSFFFTRILSALIFSLSFFVATYFICVKWKRATATIWWMIFLPMPYVLGARVSTDAATIPLFTLTLFLLIELWGQRPAQRSSRLSLLCALFAALTLGCKAYPLVLIPVCGILFVYEIFFKHELNFQSRIKGASLLILPVILMLLIWSPWLYDNLLRTGSVTGQAELSSLKARGLTTLSAQMNAARELYTIWIRETFWVWIGLIAHFLFVANWTLGLAPKLFYPIQGLVFVIPFFWLIKNSIKKKYSPPELSFGLLLLLGFIYGYFKFVIDFYLFFGKPTWVGGWYAWGALAALLAVFSLYFEKVSVSLRRFIVLIQIGLFVIAAWTNYAYMSGNYDRSPFWRTPIENTGKLIPK